MKKKIFLLLSIILFLSVYNCTGYKPIFSNENLNFKIIEYEILGEKVLGQQIYSRLNNLSRSTKGAEKRNINFTIKITKKKEATGKDSTGKILGYRIKLNTQITVTDSQTINQILNQNFSYSLAYKVQDQKSETVKIENKTLEDLITKTYQEVLIKLIDNIS